MSLITNYEKPINGLHKSFLCGGSFELVNGIPYIYNNQATIVKLYDLDEKFNKTENNIVNKTKSFKDINGFTYNIPLLKKMIKINELDKSFKIKKDISYSMIYKLPFFKYTGSEIDKFGILLNGIVYDIESETKYKTVGIRAKYGFLNNGTEYGITLWVEALQYDRDDDDNLVVTSIKKSSNTASYTYNYSMTYLTLLHSVYTDGDDLVFTLGSVEANDDGNRIIDIEFKIDTDDINISYSNTGYVSIEPDKNISIEYSLFDFKVYASNLSFNLLEYQSKINIKI